jgi:hypothetical protein
MHIKKNMFENIFNTMMDVKGKTKNNIKDKMDIPLFYHHNNMKLVYNGSRVAKLKANFALDNNA